MKESFKFELNRKFMHLLSLLYLAIYLIVETLYSYSYAIGFLIVLLVVSFFYEEIRLREARNKFEKYFKSMTNKLAKFHRIKELNSLSGSMYMLLGIVLSLVIFDRRIAFAVIFMAIFGDLFAALIGKRFGKIKLFNKTLEGTLAGFFINIIIGLIFIRGPLALVFTNTFDMFSQIFIYSPHYFVIILMALLASFAELYFEHIDDNLTIPIFAGIGGSFFYLNLANDAIILFFRSLF